jgi:hypothetical protein
MDHGQFDDLTRSMASGSASRRAVLRLVSGSALAVVVARLGLDEAAAGNKHGKERRHGALQAERRHHQKKHHKKAKDPQPCGDGERRCHDGSCVNQGQCCPNERSCDGGSCVVINECCPGERRCDDGWCVPEDLCCQTAKRCGDGSCIAANQCCPDAIAPTCNQYCEAVVCDHGELVCRSTCGSGECCHGGCWDTCPSGSVRNVDTCQCECPSGSELLADGERCCPSSRACGRNGAGLATICCDEANSCRPQSQICS